MHRTVDQTKGIYRRIYSGFLTGRRINAVPLEVEAWFWRLQALADDFGAFPADPTVLASQAAPRRKVGQAKCERYLAALVTARLIRLYEVGGERFGEIAMFSKFQGAGPNGRRIRKYPPNPLPWDDGANPAESGSDGANPESECKSNVPHTQTHTHTQTHHQAQPSPQGGVTAKAGGGGDSGGEGEWRTEAERRMVTHGLSPGRAREFAQHPLLTKALLAETWKGVINDPKTKSRIGLFVNRMREQLGISK